MHLARLIDILVSRGFRSSNQSESQCSVFFRRTLLAIMQRRWTRAARNIITSLADVAGDWLFWLYTVRDNPLLDKYNIAVFTLVIVSTFFGTVNLLSECSKCNTRVSNRSKDDQKCSRTWSVCRFNRAQLAEIFLEDVGQIVISVMVLHDLYGWTPTLALNLTTSILNICFDTLDIIDDYLDISDAEGIPS